MVYLWEHDLRCTIPTDRILCGKCTQINCSIKTGTFKVIFNVAQYIMSITPNCKTLKFIFSMYNSCNIMIHNVNLI